MSSTRVKVQLTMDLEEVEVFVRKMLNDEYNTVAGDLTLDFDELLNTKDPRHLVNLLDDFRLTLAKLDNRLLECQNALDSSLKLERGTYNPEQNETIEELNEKFCKTLDKIEEMKQQKERNEARETIEW